MKKLIWFLSRIRWRAVEALGGYSQFQVDCLCDDWFQKGVDDTKEDVLYDFAIYLNERCDLNVSNMVRPFMEGEENV